MHEIAARRGLDRLRDGMREILDYASAGPAPRSPSCRTAATRADDVLEDDLRDADVSLHVAAVLEGDRLVLDFSGTDPQVDGNLNCPLSVTKSASFFAVRVLTDPDAPVGRRAPPDRDPRARRMPAQRRLPRRGGAGTSRRRAASPTSCSRHSVRRRAPAQGQDDEQPHPRGEGFTYYETTGAARARAPAPTARARSTSRCRTPSTPPSRRSRASFQSGCASCRCAGERRRGALQGRRRRGPRARGARADALRPDHRAAQARTTRSRGRRGRRSGTQHPQRGIPPLEGRASCDRAIASGSRPRWRRVSIRLATSLTNLGLPRSCSTIRALKRA